MKRMGNCYSNRYFGLCSKDGLQEVRMGVIDSRFGLVCLGFTSH